MDKNKCDHQGICTSNDLPPHFPAHCSVARRARMSFFLGIWAELKKKNKIKNVQSPPKRSDAPLRLVFADQLRTPVYLTPAKNAKLKSEELHPGHSPQEISPNHAKCALTPGAKRVGSVSACSHSPGTGSHTCILKDGETGPANTYLLWTCTTGLPQTSLGEKMSSFSSIFAQSRPKKTSVGSFRSVSSAPCWTKSREITVRAGTRPGL